MKYRIMCLDDEQDICEILLDNLSAPNREIFTFTDPMQFLQQATVIRPHLVLLDFRLPTMNGDEVATRLDPSTPKILLSGDLELKPASKFDLIMVKPIDFELLESTIRKFEQNQS